MPDSPSQPRIVYRTLRPEERSAFVDLMEIAFGERVLFERYLDHDPRLGPDDTFVAVKGSRLVASVQLFTRTILAPNGAQLLLGGIGSVATHPDYERRGIATHLLGEVRREMRRRRMPLSLLFAARIPFYERLGWRHFPHTVWVLRWPESARAKRVIDSGEAGEGAGDSTLSVRDYAPDDRASVTGMYAAFNAHRCGTTARDAAYWDGQLVFAGNPDEVFRVAEVEGRVVAYARGVVFDGLDRIIEYAARPGHEPALAAVLARFARAADAPLFVTAIDDPALRDALASSGATRDDIAFPAQMWRIEDRAGLEACVADAGSLNDEELLRAVVEPAVFWPSDRF